MLRYEFLTPSGAMIKLLLAESDQGWQVSVVLRSKIGKAFRVPVSENGSAELRLEAL